MKHSVIYTKPLQKIDPKTKQRTIIPAGTAAELNDDQLAGVRHAVRIVKSRAVGRTARVTPKEMPAPEEATPEAGE